MKTKRVALVVAATLVLGACVGTVDDPVGDAGSAGGQFDIVRATVDHRTNVTYFRITVAATGAPPEFRSMWCIGSGNDYCRNGYPASQETVVLRYRNGSATWFINYGRGGNGCEGVGNFDGKSTYSAAVPTSCLFEKDPIRFLAMTPRLEDGYEYVGTAYDSTGLSGPIALSD
jgi:hypothetical protein